jgi:hypothetical protein
MIINIIDNIQIFFVDALPNALSSLSSIWFEELLSMTPLMLGIILQLAIIALLIFLVR